MSGFRGYTRVFFDSDNYGFFLKVALSAAGFFLVVPWFYFLGVLRNFVRLSCSDENFVSEIDDMGYFELVNDGIFYSSVKDFVALIMVVMSFVIMPFVWELFVAFGSDPMVVYSDIRGWFGSPSYDLLFYFVLPLSVFYSLSCCYILKYCECGDFGVFLSFDALVDCVSSLENIFLVLVYFFFSYYSMVLILIFGFAFVGFIILGLYELFLYWLIFLVVFMFSYSVVLCYFYGLSGLIFD